MPPGGRVLTTDQDQEATPPELLECSGVIPLQGSPDMVLKPPEIIPTSAACLGIHKGFSGCGKEPVRFHQLFKKGPRSLDRNSRCPEMHLVPALLQAPELLAPS